MIHTVYTASRIRCTHSYYLIRIETGKISIKSLLIRIISIISHFRSHRLIPKLHGSLSMQTKMADSL